VAQTASVLLEEMQGGLWGEWLPGEHALCAQLHVSRKTLRAALDRLQQEGVVKCGRGQRRRIVSRKPAVATCRSKRVVLLMPTELESLEPFVVCLIDRLRTYLAEEGYQFETHASQALYRARVPEGLESLSKALNPAGWVLLHSTELIQRWFAARQLPCVVVGSCYDGIRLSSVDVDYDAICPHAVNQFISRGHKRLTLIKPQLATPGDTRTEIAFLEAAARKNAFGIHGDVVKHDGTVAGVCMRVDSLMARAQPSTAFLVSRAHHFLTVMTRLLSSGARVPHDVALISCEDESYLEAITPTAARYSKNPKAFFANTSRLVMNMIRGTGRIEECKVMPNFIRGQTLG
jgi:LacI family transcriptional regulator